jgi:hypothetical protein
MSTYVDPGPTVYSGGSIKSAGGACTGYAASETPGKSTPTPVTSPAQGSTTLKTTASSPTSSVVSSGGGGSSSCAVAQYGQCGGTGFTGCTTCAVSDNLETFSCYRINKLTEYIVWTHLLSSIPTILLSMYLKHCKIGMVTHRISFLYISQNHL